MQTLRRWLADPAVRLITLIGPGGVGKTRLALEIARAIAEEAAVRVVFVPLAAIRNPAFVASAIAEALGLSDVTALDLPRRARVACADRPTLLVLDNFEHVLDAAPLVADLLTSVASLRLMVTSRAPLHVRGEREYAVGPLALEPGVGREVARRSGALARGATLRGTGAGRATGLSSHGRERSHRGGDLSTARCAAARPRAGRPVDQGADGGGSAPPTQATTSCSRPPARAISPNASRR